MSLIKSRIYCRLYSAKALAKPPGEIFQTVKELHAELEEWKKDYPFDEKPKLKVAEKDLLCGFASIGLHFVYYNALIMIHRIPLLLNYLITSRDEPEDLRSLSKAHAAKSSVICVQAARDTLKMVNNMPWGDIAWIWCVSNNLLGTMRELTRHLRFLLYYVFLSAATIFSNIIRDTRHPQVREDLASLNMAATFFATLVPGDRPANYAGFMMRMSATLERIARMAVDKDEKRARDPEERDRDDEQPGAKRHNHRIAPMSYSKTRHGRFDFRTSMTSNASSHHLLTTAPSASNASTNGPSLRDLGIPETIEGFPPVNSSGYVVPMSPDSTTFATPTDQAPTTPATATYPLSLGLTNLDGPESHPTSYQTTLPSWHRPQNTTQPHIQDTNTSAPHNPDNTHSHSPYSQTSSTINTIPDSWQVPLTADWTYGDNLWAGLFPTETIAASAQAQDISLPILSAESFLTVPPGIDNTSNSNSHSNEPELGYGGTGGYTFSAGTGMSSVQGTSRDGDQAGESHWPNGFLGLF